MTRLDAPRRLHLLFNANYWFGDFGFESSANLFVAGKSRFIKANKKRPLHHSSEATNYFVGVLNHHCRIRPDGFQQPNECAFSSALTAVKNAHNLGLLFGPLDGMSKLLKQVLILFVIAAREDLQQIIANDFAVAFNRCNRFGPPKI